MTARNLMGQIDGTNNPKPAETDFDRADLRPGVADATRPGWRGGSYAVVRRIRMLLDDWEKLLAGTARSRSSGAASPTARR